MPVLPKADVEFGFVGLTVVLAFQKDTAPAMLVSVPATTRTTAVRARTKNNSSIDLVTKDTPHITTAMSSARATGGTFSSRVWMVRSLMHNV
jgi:hypothetical protein